MGQQQSSPGTGRSAGDTAPTPKVCYYDVLGLERDADEIAIKKAYRRKALELHPDKNPDDIENATRRFAEVQAAHEILSDPQERAWYDDHRDAILSGVDDAGAGAEPTTFHNVKLTSVEEINTLMRKFNATIPFTDERDGFYGIARETFEHLALEEEAAADAASIDCTDLPTFGFSDDDYEKKVKPFYNAWAGFNTTKSFSWKDKYRLTDAPDRRIRRLMEKENNALREEAKKEFNATVRFLVTFVRKRDPRYKPNSQTVEERQQAMRDAAKKQAARSRAANQAKVAEYETPSWVQSREESPNVSDVDFSDEVEEEQAEEVLACVVCDKIFKSENQLEAHERSKKHQKALYQLRKQMKKEGKDLDLKVNKAEKPEPVEVDLSDDARDQHQPLAEEDETSRVDDAEASASDEEPAQSPTTRASTQGSSADNDSENDDYASREAVTERLSKDVEKVALDGDNVPTAEWGESKSAKAAPAKKIGKAKQKRNRKAAAGRIDADAENQCAVCGNTFPSKTQLFVHIRDEGHAALKPTPTGKKGNGKGSGRR